MLGADYASARSSSARTAIGSSPVGTIPDEWRRHRELESVTMTVAAGNAPTLCPAAPGGA